MDGKHLGKIIAADFGLDPDREDRLCLTLNLGFDGGGTTISEYDMNVIRDTFLDAQVRIVEHLRNKPIEVIVEGNVVKSWRILTEVL